MSEYLKKFKSIFVVEDGTKMQPQPKVENKARAEPFPVNVAQETVAQQGKTTEKFVEILSAALEKQNQTGFDYLEFRQALKNLAKMPMDESTRFQSAYAMAQTMGVTVPLLVESAKGYLEILQGEQTRFNEAHAQQRSRLIGNREEEIKQLELQIKQKTEQIELLSKQIEEHKQHTENIRKEVGESTVKIENTRADFETTYETVAGQIKEDLAKMQQYLQS